MTRPDATQEPIVSALRAAGVQVWIIGWPADLLCLYNSTWKVVECKPRGYKKPRADQQDQTDFIAATNTPVVKTIHEALLVFGLVR